MRTAIAPRQAAGIRSASEMVALVEAAWIVQQHSQLGELIQLRFKPVGVSAFLNSENKKADVAEHREIFDHVGLLANELPGTPGLLSI